MVSMTAFVGAVHKGKWEGWDARAIPLASVCAWVSAIAPIASLSAAILMQFIGWLPHQVMTEPKLRPAVQYSRPDQLNMMLERINLAHMGPRPRVYSPLCASRRHSPGVIPIFSANTRRNAETD